MSVNTTHNIINETSETNEINTQIEQFVNKDILNQYLNSEYNSTSQSIGYWIIYSLFKDDNFSIVYDNGNQICNAIQTQSGNIYKFTMTVEDIDYETNLIGINYVYNTISNF